MRVVLADWVRVWTSRLLRPAGGRRAASRPDVSPAPPPQQLLAHGLTAFGVAGRPVAVLGLSGSDAALVADAVRRAGGTCVAVPGHSTGARLRIRLRGVAAVVTEQPWRDAVGAVAGDLPELHHVWCWRDGGRDELLAAADGRMPVFSD